MRERVVIFLAAIALSCATPAAARAEATGDIPAGYQVLEKAGGPFTIFYPSRGERLARETERLISGAAAGVAGELGLETVGPIRIILASDTEAYGLLHRGRLAEWAIAFSDVGQQTLCINADLVARNPRPFPAVVRHELSHLLLAQRIGGAEVPTWFMEGLAMAQAGEWGLADEWRLMTLAGRRNLPYLEELRGPFPLAADRAALAYGVSHLAVRGLLEGRPGSLMTLTAFIRDTGDFESAFASTFGMSTYDYAGKLYVEIDRRYKVPGAILDASPYWLGAALIFVAAYAVKRSRTRRKLERWNEAEARADRFWY